MYFFAFVYVPASQMLLKMQTATTYRKTETPNQFIIFDTVYGLLALCQMCWMLKLNKGSVLKCSRIQSN